MSKRQQHCSLCWRTEGNQSICCATSSSRRKWNLCIALPFFRSSFFPGIPAITSLEHHGILSVGQEKVHKQCKQFFSKTSHLALIFANLLWSGSLHFFKTSRHLLFVATSDNYILLNCHVATIMKYLSYSPNLLWSGFITFFQNKQASFICCDKWLLYLTQLPCGNHYEIMVWLITEYNSGNLWEGNIQ